MVLRAWRRPQRRTTGEPKGGVSSFHLWWQGVPREPVVEVRATIEVVQAPTAARLYFWALQATFTDATGVEHGGAHTGLQWNPRHPRNRAVNWGGYARAADVTSILEGSVSALPSTPNDPNTRDFGWEPRRPYRFRIHRSDAGWRAEVTDTTTGRTDVIRDLFARGDRLRSPVVWSEVFARCDDPPARVRWSGLEMVTSSGAVVPARAVTCNYPAYSAGDCTNTDSRLDGDGVLQCTNERRTTTTGEVLTLR